MPSMLPPPIDNPATEYTENNYMIIGWILVVVLIVFLYFVRYLVNRSDQDGM